MHVLDRFAQFLRSKWGGDIPSPPSIITSRHPRYINGPGFLAWDRGRHFHRPRAARQWLCEKRWEAALPLRVSPSSSLSSTCAFFSLLSARLTTGGPLRVTRTFYLRWPAAELSVTVADTDSPPLQLPSPLLPSPSHPLLLLAQCSRRVCFGVFLAKSVSGEFVDSGICFAWVGQCSV